MSTESFPAYRARVLSYLGLRSPMSVLIRTPARLQVLVHARSRIVLRRKCGPDSWSAVEILAHLADSELVFGWRVRTMLADRSAHLPAVDQVVWAAAGRYSRRSAARSLELFRVLRQHNVALLRGVPRREWSSRMARHDTRGRVTLAELVQLEAAHDLNHLRQLKRTLAIARS